VNNTARSARPDAVVVGVTPMKSLIASIRRSWSPAAE
jgi:hypothetical protein